MPIEKDKLIEVDNKKVKNVLGSSNEIMSKIVVVYLLLLITKNIYFTSAYLCHH